MENNSDVQPAVPGAKLFKGWTLFIDRDGVINYEKEEDYIINVAEFSFYDDAPEAMKILSQYFELIIMVTNQRGIGKGLMTIDDLNGIHQYMLQKIEEAGGRIDKIYFCPDLNDDSPNRKPNPGMALQAKNDFPQIDFSKTIMVGNRKSDMQFGRNTCMQTVFLATTHPETEFPSPLIDMKFDHLLDFAKYIQQESNKHKII